MNKRSIIILILLCLIYSISYFHRASPSVLSLDLINDLNLDPVTFGMLGSFTMLGYALAQIPSGIFTDIIGARKTLVLFQSMAAVASIIFSMSDSLSSATISRFILGFSIAATVPSLKLLAEWFSTKYYTKAASIYLSTSAIGALIASSPLAYITNIIGWRSALFFAGTITFTFAILAFFILSDSQNKEASTIKKEETKKVPILTRFKIVLSQQNFIPSFIWTFFMVGNSFVLVTLWWGNFIMQAYGLTRAQAGIILSIMSVIPLVANPILAIISDSIVKSRKKVLVGGAVLCSILFIPLAFFLEAMPRQIVFILGALITIISNASTAILFTYVKEIVPLEYTGTAFGIINTGGPFCAFILQNIFGYLVAIGIGISGIFTGYSYAFTLLFFTNCIPIVCTLYMKENIMQS